MHNQTKATIHLLGLGSGAYQELTLGAVEVLRSGLPLFLRTSVHPTVTWLEQQGIDFKSFDDLYDQADDFTILYQQIAAVLENEAQLNGDILYAVPGHPLVAERVSELLMQHSSDGTFKVIVHPAVSALESIAASLGFDPASGLIIQDALDYKAVAGDLPQLIFQVYNSQVAGNLKLSLMENYADDVEICVIRAAGLAGEERIARIALYDLDRVPWIDHLTSVYLKAESKLIAARFALDPLAVIMEQLRGPEGCPWDQEQDHQSLRRYCLEEACEVIAAIDGGDPEQLVDELGDLLLQIAFHACIGAEEGEFDLSDIIGAICAKMIRRHPHVFAEVKVSGTAEVLDNWEAIKLTERGTTQQSLLKGVGDGLPALTRARKLQEKASSVGFDWPESAGAKQKVLEEWTELQEAVAGGRADDIETEWGDLLFSLVNWARFLKIDPELALMRGCEKFRQRFLQIEKESSASGKNLISMTLPEMDAIWERLKRQGKE